MRAPQLRKPRRCAICSAVRPCWFVAAAGARASRSAVQMASWPPCAAYISAVLPSALVREASARSLRSASARCALPRWAAKSRALFPWPFWKSSLAPARTALSASRTWNPSWPFHRLFAKTSSGLSPFSSVRLTSPPASMLASAVLRSFWLIAPISIRPCFFGRSFPSIMLFRSCIFLAGSSGTGSPFSFSLQCRKGSSGSRGFTLTMSPAERPRTSSSAASAPASRRTRESSVLPCFAAIIRAVCPKGSLRFTSALASMTICSISLLPLPTQ
mmetsp:Transcript_128465/g.363598  ORF Transcript_128465/g.363598 Transcript_128465/m.363598 type:complete len:273 (+) Transcript_128465:469-1287(+)